MCVAPRYVVLIALLLVKTALLSVRKAGVLLLMQLEKAPMWKAERGSVSEILMRQSPFLLHELNSFPRDPEGKCLLLMPLCTIFLSVASVNTGFRVKYVLPYQNLPSCHSKNSQPPPSMKWKRAHHQRIWLQLMKITLHQHDTQTLFDWLKII